MYEAVQKLEYLDVVLQESLRLYPPAYRTSRECMKTTMIGSQKIPKGAIVVVPIYHIHHSPQYWDDPMKFDPERFVSQCEILVMHDFLSGLLLRKKQSVVLFAIFLLGLALATVLAQGLLLWKQRWLSLGFLRSTSL